MRIICDTNIWYQLGKEKPGKAIFKNFDLVSTFISIDELSKSFNLLKNVELAKEAIKAIFHYSDKSSLVIYEPPLVHLKKLDDPNFEYDTYDKHKLSFDLTSKIAYGLTFDYEEIRAELKSYCEYRESHFKAFAKIFNDRAEITKKQIIDKKKHRQTDTTELNRDFVSFLVSSFTKTNGLSDSFDWSKIELFMKVLKIYFNDMELGARKMQTNDINDLFLLLYVRPGEKLWTKETKWNKYIADDLKLKEYVFNGGILP